MKQYERYKDSGVEWLGRVPEHWELFAIRAFTRLKSDKGHPNYEVLSVYRDYGVVKKDSRNDNHNVTSQETITYKAVYPTDLVINKMKAWQGSMGISPYKGIVSPAYITCELNQEVVSCGYLHYLLRSNRYIDEYNRLSYGVRIGQWDMHYEDFKQIVVALPDISEQKAIAHFLDQKCAQIDKAISQKERVIELLNERRQIIIQRAVTRGLDPNVPMKDISKSWAKKIPLHWNYREIGRIAKITTGSTPPTNQEFYFNSGDINWYTPSDITENIVEVVESMRKLSYKAEENGLISLYPKGVVLLIGIGGTLGRVGYSESTCYSNQQINAIIFNNNHLSRFFVYQLKVLSSYIWANANIATIPILNQTATKRLFVCIPPYDEQQQIATYLDNINAKIDKAIAIKRQEIEKLKEYKTVLIDAAVTGKIKIA